VISSETLDLVTAFVFGTLFGSFLNAVIYRVPIGESIMRPSACPACNAKIRWYHNVPVLGWLMLRGRCADCGARISIRYPIVETVGGLILAFSIWRWGLNVSGASSAVFAYIMLALALIDVDHRLLPNVITIPGAVAGIGLAFVDPRVAWGDAIIGAVFGGGLLYLVAWLYLRARGREGMGMGDVKMMLTIGAFLGWQGALMTLFIGSLLGSIVGITLIKLTRKGWEYALPFGTFLAAAAVLVDYYGHEIFAWYWGMFGPGSP